MAGFIVSLLPN